MFDIECVKKVIERLEKEVGFFASEAHLQLSFALMAYKEYKDKFSYIPEYPETNPINEAKRDEIDLFIIDNETNETNERTMIEFKFKTANYSDNSLEIDIVGGIKKKPTNMGAQDLGRFDCWSDIERLEGYKKDGKADECFFIFVTNDELYLKDEGSAKCFSVKKDTTNECFTKMWPGCDASGSFPKGTEKIKSIGSERNRAIATKEYSFEYLKYGKYYKPSNGKRKDCGQFYISVLPIK